MAVRLEQSARTLGVSLEGIDPRASIQRHIDREGAVASLRRTDWHDGPEAMGPVHCSASVALSTLVLIPLVALLALGQLRWRNPGAEWALPFLVPLWAAVWAFAEHPYGGDGQYFDSWLATQIACMVAGMACSFVRGARRAILWLVWLAIVAGLLQGGCELLAEQGWLPWPSLAPTMSAAWIISVILGIACVMSRASKPAWFAWSVVVVQVYGVAVLAGAALVNEWMLGIQQSSYWISSFVLLVVGATFAPRPQFRLVRLLGPGLLAGALVFGSFAGYEIWVDGQWGRVIDQELSRVERARNAAGTNRRASSPFDNDGWASFCQGEPPSVFASPTLLPPI